MTLKLSKERVSCMANNGPETLTRLYMIAENILCDFLLPSPVAKETYMQSLHKWSDNGGVSKGVIISFYLNENTKTGMQCIVILNIDLPKFQYLEKYFKPKFIQRLKKHQSIIKQF